MTSITPVTPATPQIIAFQSGTPPIVVTVTPTSPLPVTDAALLSSVTIGQAGLLKSLTEMVFMVVKELRVMTELMQGDMAGSKQYDLDTARADVEFDFPRLETDRP